MTWSSDKGWNTSGWGHAAPAGGGSFTTLDTVNKGSTAVVDTGNLAFHVTSGQSGVRSLASFSSGKKRYEVLFPAGYTGYTTIGVADAGWGMSGGYHGSGNSFGFGTPGTVGIGVTTTGDSLPNPVVTPEWWAVEFDAGTGDMWVLTPRGTYGPFNISTGGSPPSAPFFFSSSMDTTGQSLLHNFGASAWNRTPSSGFVGI